MSSQGDGDQLERLAEEAVQHLGLIRKYTAWIAFFVVLFGVLAMIGFFFGTFGSVF